MHALIFHINRIMAYRIAFHFALKSLVPLWCSGKAGFSTRRNFARGVHGIFLCFSNWSHPKNHKTKKNSAPRAKIPLFETGVTKKYATLKILIIKRKTLGRDLY